jgi:hypothetical protein
VNRQHGAVPHFERWHLVDQPKVVGERNLTAIEMQKMIQRKKDTRFAETRRDLEHISSQRLQLAMQALGLTVDAKVHLDVTRPHPAGHFLRNEEVRGSRMCVEVFETATDRIVIGDGDEIHPA